MKIELEFTEKDIDYLTHTHCSCFLSEHGDHFEVLSNDVVFSGNDPHGDFTRSFLNDYDGYGTLAWIDGKYLEAKIYADWWTKKLGKQCHILWELENEEEDGGFVVWLPKSFL